MIEFKVLSNGKRLRFSRSGAGRDVVFLHGYPDNHRIFDKVTDTLQTDFRCWAIDWPGMGDSEEWPGGATPAHMAGRLAQILAELGIERPVLVAHDMGGQAILEFAAADPQSVAKLIVMNTLAFGDGPTSWEIRWLRDYGWNRRILKYLPHAVFWRGLLTFLPKGSSLSAAVRKDLWLSFKRASVRRFISKMCAGYQGVLPKLPARYAQIDTPTLILWGEHDAHFPVAQGERLHASIVGSRFRVLPSGTHWMVWARAEEVAAEIREFLLDPSHGLVLNSERQIKLQK